MSPNDIGHLSLPSDSGLPIDMTNGSDLGSRFDSTVGDGYDLGSSSFVYPFERIAYNDLGHQSPLVPRDIGWHLSLPSDSGLPFPMDVTNGSGLGFGFDSTICDGFDLGSLSTAYPSVLLEDILAVIKAQVKLDFVSMSIFWFSCKCHVKVVKSPDFRYSIVFEASQAWQPQDQRPKKHVRVCRAIDNWQLLIIAEGFWQASSNLLWV
uniref:Uncharacterized protein n=1 Tax=Quercus lobata TaxID=97700 RepID=A0A7N2LXN0_QUELO